jgi:hypothetical protein
MSIQNCSLMLVSFISLSFYSVSVCLVCSLCLSFLLYGDLYHRSEVKEDMM